VVSIIIIWQIYFVVNIPDMDTDAYVHHVIARQIIMSPKDLSIHWVWLPLFHYISAGAILMGAKIDAIRFANIFIWASVPVILFFFIYRHKAENNLLKAFLSSIFCTLFPIGILMGTTAQPEPLFALLILLFITSAANERFIISSIILSFACMLRYEAWAAVLAAGIFYLTDIIRNRRFIINKKIFNILLPAAVILAWAVLRVPFDGKLFGFLFQTQQFANDALNETNSFSGGIIKILYDIIYYPVFIPFLFTGINILFIPFGIKKFYKYNKWFLITGAGILAFITFSWILKSNLGLNRHFVSLIPLYSTLSAYGIANAITYLKKSNIKIKILKPENIKFTILTIIFISSLTYLIMWLSIWNANFREGFPERKTAAEFLRNIPDNKPIFCNDAIVEVFSDINFRRFNHVWMENNPGAPEIIMQAAIKDEHVYVITTPDKWKNINEIGKIIYQSPANTRTNTTVLILEVDK
jgi:hypothetical protein